MRAHLGQLADAVADALNGAPPATFDAPFTAVKAWRVEHQLADLVDPTVTVTGRSAEHAVASRGAARRDLEVEINVRRQLDPAAGVTVDAMLALVEQIAGRLFGRNLEIGGQGFVWTATRQEPAVDPEHLDRFNLFDSLLVVSYRTNDPQ